MTTFEVGLFDLDEDETDIKVDSSATSDKLNGLEPVFNYNDVKQDIQIRRLDKEFRTPSVASGQLLLVNFVEAKLRKKLFDFQDTPVTKLFA